DRSPARAARASLGERSRGRRAGRRGSPRRHCASRERPAPGGRTLDDVPAEHAGPRSLRQLLDAVLTLGSDLDLTAVLQRIVQAAVTVVQARYRALRV